MCGKGRQEGNDDEFYVDKAVDTGQDLHELFNNKNALDKALESE